MILDNRKEIPDFAYKVFMLCTEPSTNAYYASIFMLTCLLIFHGSRNIIKLFVLSSPFSNPIS